MSAFPGVYAFRKGDLPPRNVCVNPNRAPSHCFRSRCRLDLWAQPSHPPPLIHVYSTMLAPYQVSATGGKCVLSHLSLSVCLDIQSPTRQVSPMAWAQMEATGP